MGVKIDAFIPQFTPTAKKNAERAEQSAAEGKTDGFTPSEKTRQLLQGMSSEDQKSMLEEMLENSKEQAEAQSKGFEELAKCMKIAARIMNGDIVPQKDHKFLAEKYPDLYEKAVLMRRINPEPKKYKSLIEDEEDTTEVSGEETGEELPPEIAAMEQGGEVSAEMSGGE